MKRRPKLPRVVIVTRRSPLEHLLEHFGTPGQVRFFLGSHGQEIGPYEEAHGRLEAGVDRVFASMPAEQRRVRVDRDELDRFLFAPDDLVVVVGQDGLVANTAKYLSGQLLVGLNPDPERYDGVLCPHPTDHAAAVLGWLVEPGGDEFSIQSRTMVEARREDGERLLALNEIFLGHRSHQSARYRVRVGDRQECQASSGVLCTTGTGSTGWALSIVRQRAISLPLPTPEEERLTWFVREPFPSVATGVEMDFGFLEEGDKLTVVSQMSEGGVFFGDGIESDAVEFLDGRIAVVGIARERLHLVVPRRSKARAAA